MSRMVMDIICNNQNTAIMLSMSIFSAGGLLFVDNSSIPVVKVLQDDRRSAGMAPINQTELVRNKAQSQKMQENQS